MCDLVSHKMRLECQAAGFMRQAGYRAFAFLLEASMEVYLLTQITLHTRWTYREYGIETR